MTMEQLNERIDRLIKQLSSWAVCLVVEVREQTELAQLEFCCRVRCGACRLGHRPRKSTAGDWYHGIEDETEDSGLALCAANDLRKAYEEHRQRGNKNDT